MANSIEEKYDQCPFCEFYALRKFTVQHPLYQLETEHAHCEECGRTSLVHRQFKMTSHQNTSHHHTRLAA